MALSPVCKGSFTDWRTRTPGALNSMGRVSVATMGPLPSNGRPRGSMTRPNRPLPTGTLAILPVRFTVSPSLMSLPSPQRTTPTLDSSRFRAMPSSPPGNSKSSPDMQSSRPYTRAMPSPTDRMIPIDSIFTPASYCVISCFKILVISSGRSAIVSPFVIPAPARGGKAGIKLFPACAGMTIFIYCVSSSVLF